MNSEHERKHALGNRVVTAKTAGGAMANTIEGRPAPPPARPASAGPVVIRPEATGATFKTHGRASSQRERAQVRLAPQVLDLLTIPAATPQVTETAREQRDLNAVVHGVLMVGLAISTALMLAGIGLDLFLQRDLPAVVPDLGEVLARVAALRPSGFLALGLLVLIATPILRVIGSIGAFVYERDWRFAGITTLVLGVLIVSLVLGRG